MDIIPQIFTAKVMHKRLFPKQNKFTYRLYYLVLPLPAPIIAGKLVYFNPKDLGYRDGNDPEIFAKAILVKYGLGEKVKNIMLVTMPCVLGYVFNPISFYFCLDEKKMIRTVIAEVHNTFGEQHAYVCFRPDHEPITGNDSLKAKKMFHVSPFLERTGSYSFRFSIDKNKMGIWIDYLDKENNKQLLTSLVGDLKPLDKLSLHKAFWSHPLLTFKTITLIHWQALKLLSKNLSYIIKPKQYDKKVSITLKAPDPKSQNKP